MDKEVHESDWEEELQTGTNQVRNSAYFFFLTPFFSPQAGREDFQKPSNSLSKLKLTQINTTTIFQSLISSYLAHKLQVSTPFFASNLSLTN